ncbi:hypothetical protein ACFV23_29120, partial [Streptomyces sp. NPDC059627]
MARVRYGARTEAEIAAARTTRLPDVWSTGVVAVWETDPGGGGGRQRAAPRTNRRPAGRGGGIARGESLARA